MAKKKSKILVCVSEKEHSLTALRFACSKAKSTNNKVEMLYVINPVDYNTIFSVADIIKEERHDNAKKLLKQLTSDMKDEYGLKITHLIKEGKISDVICTCIEEDHNISLLIIGAAPDGSTAKAGLLSKLTDEIGSRLHIPIMIVPGNLTDQQIEELS